MKLKRHAISLMSPPRYGALHELFLKRGAERLAAWQLLSGCHEDRETYGDKEGEPASCERYLLNREFPEGERIALLLDDVHQLMRIQENPGWTHTPFAYFYHHLRCLKSFVAKYRGRNATAAKLGGLIEEGCRLIEILAVPEMGARTIPNLLPIVTRHDPNHQARCERLVANYLALGDAAIISAMEEMMQRAFGAQFGGPKPV